VTAHAVRIVATGAPDALVRFVESFGSERLPARVDSLALDQPGVDDPAPWSLTMDVTILAPR
jgi:hypothetical protein